MQNTNFSGDGKELTKNVFELSEKLKVTQTIRWNWASLVKILSRNHRTSTLHRSQTNGIAERAEQYAEDKKGRLL